MSVLPEVLAANDAYAQSFGDRGSLALPPARRFAILTCMDARLDPAKYAGLAEGDAHVIRNAGLHQALKPHNLAPMVSPILARVLAPPKVATSTGSLFLTPKKASLKMLHAFAIIHSCHETFRFMATSTTCVQDDLLKCQQQLQLVRLNTTNQYGTYQ